jgi:hypothetical protein
MYYQLTKEKIVEVLNEFYINGNIFDAITDHILSSASNTLTDEDAKDLDKIYDKDCEIERISGERDTLFNTVILLSKEIIKYNE